MSKKSFKNPALSFISQSDEVQKNISENTQEIISKNIFKEIPLEQNHVKEVSNIPQNKKISKNEIVHKTPTGYKVNPMYVETKSKRVQCLLQPSVVEKLKDKANKHGISMNEAINEAIHMYMNV